MSTFICILGFIVFCVGTAIVANSFKPPFGPLGVLLVVGGAFVSIILSKKIEKWRIAKKQKLKEESMGQGSP